MDPIAPSGINRRVMLSTLAMLPALSGLLHSIPAAAQAPAEGSPLPSWNDGAAKQAILDFVRATTDQSSQSYVRPQERIATFDQDGTLWVEHPMYSQVVYCLDRVPAVVAKRPELRNAEPFKTVLSGNRAAMAKLSMRDLEKILAATLTGMTVEEFNAEAVKWLETARHPRWQRPSPFQWQGSFHALPSTQQYSSVRGLPSQLMASGFHVHEADSGGSQQQTCVVSSPSAFVHTPDWSCV